MTEKILIISGIIILVILYLNYKESLEPFQNELEENMNIEKGSINELIENLNEELNFDDVSRISSQKVQNCNLENRILETNQGILNNDFNNKNVQSLKDTVNELENKILQKEIKNKLSRNYNSVISMNNGAKFSVENIGLNNYLVRMNNGCLGVRGNSYDVLKCNKSDPNQHFRFNNIFNEYSYSKNSIYGDYIEDKNNINYPFITVQSEQNNRCLTNNNNNVRIMPCNMLKSQRFKPLEDEHCH